MNEVGQGVEASFFLNKPVAIFIDDKDRIQRRDGILRGFDHTHLYLELTYAGKAGEVVSYLRTDVKRIILTSGGGSHLQ
jgi:hypothetical protein